MRHNGQGALNHDSVRHNGHGALKHDSVRHNGHGALNHDSVRNNGHGALNHDSVYMAHIVVDSARLHLFTTFFVFDAIKHICLNL